MNFLSTVGCASRIYDSNRRVGIRAQLLNQSDRGIVRAIADKDDFEVGIILIANCAEVFAQSFIQAATRHKHGDEWSERFSISRQLRPEISAKSQTATKRN